MVSDILEAIVQLGESGLPEKNGISFTIVPNLELDAGIDAARHLLNRCWFDEHECSVGIKSLDAYRRAWNEKHGCWASRPLHNAASHGADAFRMLVVWLQLVKDCDVTAEELEKRYREAKGLIPYFEGFFSHINSTAQPYM